MIKTEKPQTFGLNIPFLSNMDPGELIVLLVLLLLLWEGRPEASGTVLTLILFLLL
ncbi:MAG: hypothetical protein IKM59_05555 [Oscillospiraceae bacterium]|nr:hypothetical protein [Oscillospiraceae bacterium]